MTTTKCNGGLGFKEIETQNITLLIKMAWRMNENGVAFWVCMLVIDLYFPNNDLLHESKWERSSWAWVSLIAGRDMIVKHVVRITEVKDVNILKDPWIPYIPNGHISGWLLGLEIQRSVQSLRSMAAISS